MAKNNDKKEYIATYHLKRKQVRNYFLGFFVFVLFAIVSAAQYATGEFGFSAECTKVQGVAPREEVVINFDHPIYSKALQKNFRMQPAAPVELVWQNNYQQLVVKPLDYFDAGTKYIIYLSPTASFSFTQIAHGDSRPLEVEFETEKIPTVKSILPVSGNSSVPIESDIKIDFARSTVGYDISFDVEPKGKWEYFYDDERREFVLKNSEPMKFEADYVVSVRGAVAGAVKKTEDMPEIFRANFKTVRDPEVVRAEEDAKYKADKSGYVPDSRAVTTKAAIAEGRYIDINLSEQQLAIFENGRRLGTYKVSTGKRGMATPTGTYKILEKRGRAWSNKYKLYMPYFMLFTGAGHGIHELPEWPGGYKEGQNHLGIPVSHGCVRLGVGPAEIVYSFSDVGTPVVVHY